ncbi:signal peptide peptidase SppA [Candidatus Avelusimicrobium faecicola]|uniref:signal peptide peptidase SppA n=1 Tax=Candidatus Avelusimicrobium faecicola TaxID=3416205 RepID=UPI00159F8DA2
MNTEDWKETFPTQTSQSLPKEVWEKKLLENEKTAPVPQAAAEPEEPSAEKLADNPEPPAQEPPAQKPPKPAKHGSYRNLWSFLLLLTFTVSAVCGVLLVLKPGMKCTEPVGKTNTKGAFVSGLKSSGDGLAWIKVRGVIAESGDSGPFSRQTGASAIAKKIRTAAADDAVKAIVIDINSPGGTVASVQNIYSEIQAAKQKGKKVVALFRDVAASGGFYIAMAADKIVAEPGTITGSVGVIMQTNNVEGLFKKIGVSVTPITSGKYKDIGSSYRPMTDAEKALLQDMVSETYGQFFAAVKAGRPGVKPADLTEYTDGRVFTGERAYKLGFIDKLGGEEEARLLAGELAGLKDPKILSNRGESLREAFFSFGSNLEGQSLAKQLESLTTPNVSYLWSN